MTSEESFADKVIKSFKNITKEIEKGSSEHDVRYRFVKYFVEEVLNYEPKYIKWEKKRADLTIIDENDFAVIKIETKKPTVNINKPEHEEQAFKYEEEATRYIGLTNFLQFKLWEIKRKDSTLKVNLDFSSIVEQKKSFEDLSSDEQSQILFVKLRFGYHSFPLTAFAQMGGMFASLRSAQPSVPRSSRTQNHQDMTALA